MHVRATELPWDGAKCAKGFAQRDEGKVAAAVEVRESEVSSSRAVWFGPTGRPLFGWLHLPAQARAGVVLCRPIGLEALSSCRAYRCLAEQLACAGLVTLRFDYTGTGDSAGDTADEVTIATWLSDITAAVDFVRQTGVSCVGLIGLRLGAMLAVKAATGNDIETLVLWDPCETGRGFLREQHLLAVAAGIAPERDPAAVEGVEVPALPLSEDLAAAIRALRLDDDLVGVSPKRLFVLTRADKALSASVQEELATKNVEFGRATGQVRFIGVEPGAAVLPEQTLADIVSWQSRAFDGAPAPMAVRAQPERPAKAIVARTADGRAIIERTVRIGAGNLFGIVTEPEDTETAHLPSVLFTNAGVLTHSGPAHVWVEMARDWAAQGVRALRVDLGGLGDSPTRPGRQPDQVYPVEAIEDLIDAARFVAPQDPAGVALVGLCSGGYHAIEGALVLDSRRAWVINPGFPRVPPELSEKGSTDPRRQTVRPLNSITRHLYWGNLMVKLALATTPAAVWWVLDKLRLYPSPIKGIEAVAKRGTEILVACSEFEFSKFARRSGWTVRRLERSGTCHFEVVESMDHAIFNLTGRAALIKLLTAQVTEKLVPEFGRALDEGVRKGGPTAG